MEASKHWHLGAPSSFPTPRFLRLLLLLGSLWSLIIQAHPPRPYLTLSPNPSSPFNLPPPLVFFAASGCFLYPDPALQTVRLTASQATEKLLRAPVRYNCAACRPPVSSPPLGPAPLTSTPSLPRARRPRAILILTAAPNGLATT